MQSECPFNVSRCQGVHLSYHSYQGECNLWFTSDGVFVLGPSSRRVSFFYRAKEWGPQFYFYVKSVYCGDIIIHLGKGHVEGLHPVHRGNGVTHSNESENCFLVVPVPSVRGVSFSFED